MRFVVVGDCTLDVTVMSTVRPRRGSDVAAAIRVGPGGQGANVAVRLARLGREVHLVAPLADDPAGRLLRDALAGDGVSVRRSRAARSAIVTVLVGADGERTMLSDRQALGVISRTLLAGAGWVHCSGYPLIDDASGDRLARTLATRLPGQWLSVGGGPAPRDPEPVARYLARLRLAAPQVCLVSRDEAAALLGRRQPDARAAALALADLADVVVVTDGASGSVAALRGQLLTVPAAPLPGGAVDTTGAGDAYAAALISRLAGMRWPPRAASLRQAMDAGARLGARVARVVGAQSRVAGERKPSR
jgi:sugar/nucleoside kinase (ribokinase family)